MKKILKVIISALVLGLILNTLTGCSSNSSNNGLTGSILVTGSTALQPLADEVAGMYQDEHEDAVIDVQGGGSGTGLKDVAAGNCQIGNSDVYAEEKLPADQVQDLVDHKVAVVAFAAVVNTNVSLDNLTKQQLIDIFTGEVTNWSEVGGNDLPIVLISRPDSSGTKATFKKYALDDADEAAGQALKEDSSGAVAKAVQGTDGAIAYLASSYLNNIANIKDMKILKFEGKEMNKENIISGEYPIWSYEHMYTKGVATGLTKDFLNYFNTDVVKSKIDELGYIPTTDMKVSR